MELVLLLSSVLIVELVLLLLVFLVIATNHFIKYLYKKYCDKRTFERRVASRMRFGFSREGAVRSVEASDKAFNDVKRRL